MLRMVVILSVGNECSSSSWSGLCLFLTDTVSTFHCQCIVGNGEKTEDKRGFSILNAKIMVPSKVVCPTSI
jgi:hypothetical protein